jgi:hypothetical protein
MDRTVLGAAALALSLNLAAASLRLSYQWSVVLVFGGMVLFWLLTARKGLLPSDWKLLGGFFLFSNVCTLGLEVLMMKLRVWGFGDRVYPLTGWTFLGAPVEEYEYWAACAAIVPTSYLVLARRLKPATVEPAFLAKVVEWASSLHLQAKTDPVQYVDAEETEVGQFKQGAKFPVYACIQLAILAAIIALVRRYHGSWRAMGGCVLCFFLTAFPNEFYSIRMDFWDYNRQRMLGIFFLKIPLEGWLMYYLPAVLACMMLDVANRRFFGKDV